MKGKTFGCDRERYRDYAYCKACRQIINNERRVIGSRDWVRGERFPPKPPGSCIIGACTEPATHEHLCAEHASYYRLSREARDADRRETARRTNEWV